MLGKNEQVKKVFWTFFITLADVLRNKETFLLSIPESRKGMLGTYARKATVPAAFVLGVLSGVLGFSCTGGGSTSASSG